MIRAGDLDRLVTVQTEIEVKDSVGHVKKEWKNLGANMPCRVLPYRGKEKFSEEQSDRELSFQINKFLIRWIPGIDKKSSLLYDGERWDILSTAEYGKREGIEIVAEIIK